MNPYPILWKHFFHDVFSTYPFKFSIQDYLGDDHSIDSTQPKGWCVSITLRMQRAHHLLGGLLLVAGELSDRMQEKYGAVVREDPL